MNVNFGKQSAITLSLLLIASSSGLAADASAGKTRAAACQGCHGANGVSNSPLWPNLAGQTAAYLEAQLKNFKTGKRNNPSMNPIAADLSDADIQNLAAYFAGLAPNKPKSGASAGADKVAMCMGCHGQQLQGNGQIPRLAGQQAKYLIKQLEDFKSGSRQAGPMNALAKSLSAEDIRTVAEYLSGQN